MQPSEKFIERPSYEELIRDIRQELINNQRPPNEVILDETDFCSLLHISKRHAANLRANRLITYSKSGGKIYYRLSDVLEFIEKNEIKCIDRTNSIFKPKMIRK